MKYFILFIFLCFIPFQSIAQHLTYKDLETILDTTLVESSEYLENKSFHIYSIKKEDGFDTLSYNWVDSDGSYEKFYLIMIGYDKVGFKSIYYDIPSLNHFNNLKKSIEQIGFKLVDSYLSSESKSIVYEYISTNYTISMKKGVKSNSLIIKHNAEKIFSGEIVPKY